MLFSIITINYNNSSGLESTIKSVIDQSYKDFEYIIIDGDSTDGSKEIIKKYKDHFSYSISEPDSGIYSAMNKGIKVSKAEYLLFLNSGDIFYSKDVLEEFEKFEEKGDVNYGNIYFDYGTRKSIWRPPVELKLSILYDGSLPHPGTFFKKKLFETYGNYDESYRIVADWAYYFKLFLESNVKFKKIDLMVSIFSKDGISSFNESLKIIQKERNRFLNENFSIGLNKSIFDLLEKEKELEILTNRYNRLSSNVFVQFALRINRFRNRLIRSILTFLL